MLRGLAANKIMGKYQRPCCVLTNTADGYQGSARGCDIIGVTEFKDICENTGMISFAQGHQRSLWVEY